MFIAKNAEDLNNQVSAAYESIDVIGSKYPTMSYEQGVVAALDWVLGNTDIAPMAEDG